MLAILFPGQGSQYPMMGQKILKDYISADYFFQKTDNLLKRKLSTIIISGSASEIRKTSNAQVAIFLISAIIWNEFIKYINIEDIQILAGHSVGQYTALYASGVLSFNDCVYLLDKRGTLMESCSSQHDGTMLVCISNRIDLIQQIILEINSQEDHFCAIANDNGANQIVLSGLSKSIELFKNKSSAFNMKPVDLNVSGAFHSRLMDDSSKQFMQIVREVEFKLPAIDIISNEMATVIKNDDDIGAMLASHITKPVLWADTIKHISSISKVTTLVELGPGKVLTNLNKRILPYHHICNLELKEDLISFIKKHNRVEGLDDLIEKNKI